MSGLKEAAPSLPRGLRLAQIQGQHLQGVLIPELVDKQLQLQVEPIRGVPLTMAVEQHEELRIEAARCVRQVAEALRPLHAAGLAHGRVMPDRIYWDRDTGATLARDPLCTVTTALDCKTHGVIANGLQKLLLHNSLHRSFWLRGQVATSASDIYSLGCVWWWLVTGIPLVSGATPDEHLAKQAQVGTSLPKGCKLNPPLQRVLQHTLGKNLAARFTDAQQLCAALDAALAAKPGKPATQKQLKPAPVAAQPVATQQPVTPQPVAPPAATQSASTSTQPVKPQPPKPQPEKVQPQQVQPEKVLPEKPLPEKRQPTTVASQAPTQASPTAPRPSPVQPLVQAAKAVAARITPSHFDCTKNCNSSNSNSEYCNSNRAA